MRRTAFCEILVILLVVGCGRGAARSAAHQVPSTMAVSQPVSGKDKVLIEKERPKLIQEVRVTTKSHAGDEKARNFPAGSALQAEIVFAGTVPKGYAATVEWYQGSRKIWYGWKPIPPGAKSIVFDASSARWKPGTYAIRAYMGPDKVAEIVFELTRK
jgi:hypothetical protein